MTSAELRETLQARQEEIEVLQELWHTLIPDVMPDARQFFLWLDLHNLDRMVKAIKGTSKKHAKMAGTMSLEHAVRFCSKIANVRRTEEEGPAPTA